MKRNFLTPAIAILAIFISAISCGKSSEKKDSDTTSSEDTSVDEHYHADNDIAMTVRSIVDAVNVGEPLDSADYNFHGVLTDGSGRILYSDIQGSPGEWDVKVLSPSKAVIRNVYLGDLLPDDLEIYLTHSLGLTSDDIVEDVEYDEDDTSSLTVYDFGTGQLRFEVHGGVSQNGLEGPLLYIYVSSKTEPIPHSS